MRTKKFFLMVFIVLPLLAGAQKGMWPPFTLLQSEEDMRAEGMRMPIEHIYSLKKGSLKDAIVQFGGGCTASLISPQGLLLTNHHCGSGEIQSHSTLEHNYLEDGFWAPTLAGELPNPGLTAMFVEKMEDVTGQALEGVAENLQPRERQSLIDQNLDKIKKEYPIEAHQEVMIRPFYDGHLYILFVTVTYKDVRLVGAPPASIGNFGQDTDNWVWPRHTGDFALFRIYAGPDNLPAEYSPDNVPFKPKHYLPVSIKGIKEGDFTLVMGFPGRTTSYLPSYGVQQVLEVTDPIRVGMRDIALGVMDQAMRSSAETKLRYADKQRGIANGWKKWIGEMQGLRRVNAVQKKREQEELFTEVIRDNPELNKKYAPLLEDFRLLYSEIEPFHKARTYYTEAVGVNVELFQMSLRLARMLRAFDSQGETGYKTALESTLPVLETLYKDYDPAIDQRIFTGIMAKYLGEVNPGFLPDTVMQQIAALNGDYSAWANAVYGSSLLLGFDQVKALLAKSPQEVAATLNADPFYQLTTELSDAYSQKVAPGYNNLSEQLTELQRDYMLALMEAFPQKRFFPDANSTLRVTYGRVSGYNARDAVKYGHQTHLSGIMEKYKPGDYEFDVPEKLRQLYEAKDFGRYGAGGDLPVAFIGTNHTTGGNSGSPAVDAQGNLIGLNFDRVWEGTMSDVFYDGSICRNIMVDARYILFVIEKLGGAKRLVEEMKIVD
jgi:hypothetical protein